MQCSVQTCGKQLLAIAGLVVVLLFSSGIRAEVIVQRLANDGVILSDGKSTRIMVDGMVAESYSVYGGLLPEQVADFSTASGPFSKINLVLVSHQHHDHNQPEYACKFMQNSIGTLVTSSQVVDLMREKCRAFVLSSPRIQIIDPQYDQPEILSVGDAQVSVFLLSHGGGRYAHLKNFGHLIDLGGMRTLHIGDAAMEAADFERAAVPDLKVDIALIPFWYFQPGPGGAMVRKFLTARHMVATHIPPGELAEVKAYMSVEYPHVVLLENPLDEVRFGE
jgi:L-ascorbate metabolism protein UlaG (beta-lactamase superfamily)